MKTESRKKVEWGFGVTFLIIIAIFLLSVWKTHTYNNTRHHEIFEGAVLFSSEDAKENDVSIRPVPRSSTWTKVFDIHNEGLTEPNFQAYTYDFNVSNHTGDDVAEFSFQLTFHHDVFLLSAWNGALEVHQKVAGGEMVATVPDLREFVPSNYAIRTANFDGEALIHMKAGDYLVYHPSSSMNAMAIPIKPYEGTTPGFILYVRIGESINDSSLELTYTFHRLLTSEPLFVLSMACLALWLVALIIFAITSAQIRKYKERHERDNEIINEAIETFTGFIDARDPYTSGHSKRVAIYTRRIAEEMGYTDEELDRIYYIALLHDCGKIGVPDHILGKPSRLTDEEYEIIKDHTVRGGEVLDSFKSLENVSEGALYHHERYDGTGYPARLAGRDIPLIARMICVADSFDAMNSNRVYRKKRTKEYIIDEIEKNKGSQFDPEIADIMLRLLKENKIAVENP